MFMGREIDTDVLFPEVRAYGKDLVEKVGFAPKNNSGLSLWIFYD